MIRTAVLCALALGALAQDKAPAEKTVAQLEAEKRDPKKRAEALLESASGAAASVKPETQVAALAQIGENYQLIDSKKAILFLRQAFAASAALADHPSQAARGQAQTSIIEKTAPLDVNEAIAMLRQMEPLSTAAAGKIIDELIKKKDMDQALGLIELLTGNGSFPYGAARRLFKALPAEDARRLGLFAAATSAYSAKQDNQYADLLVAAWDDLPRDMAASALDTLVKQITGLKEDNNFLTTTLSGPKGAVHFDNRADAELFKVMYLVERMDAKRAKEILDSRPALRSAMQQFPLGYQSMEVQNTMVSGGGGKPPGDQQARAQLRALSETRGSAAMKALSESTQKAISLAADIPMADVRAVVLAAIARSASEKDPTGASVALSKCIALLDDLKDPEPRVNAWTDVARAAHQAGNDQLARQALERMLADAGEMYKKDANDEAPNQALRDQWPSTNAYRKMVIAAARVLGVDAEPMLEQIKDPDLRLLAQVDLAQALLGRERTNWSSSISRTKR